MDKVLGSMSAIITPFKNGKLDEEAYERLIKRQFDLGMDATVPMGTTGESATLSQSEHEACVKIAVSVAKGRGKVLAGAGSNCTKTAISLTKLAKDAGANAILSVVPYYNKPSMQGLYEHFSEIARAAGDMGVLLYNVPGRSSLCLDEETILRLFKDHPNIYGVKDATGDVAGAISLLSKSEDLALLSGDDALNLPLLAAGGKGVISVTGNLLPDKISLLNKLCLEGDFKNALDLAKDLVAINQVLFCEANPLPIKAAMHIAGLCELEYRLPLCKPSKESLVKIEKIMKNYNIKG